ncbi:Hsp20/alpha crystallin family protein [Nostoc ellipsosporum NOK]|nr:Hsp20/alpha crystallin family protein [Nostoc ellipsosporum NOK]
MSTKTLAKPVAGKPGLINDFFKPWNEWLDDGLLSFRQRSVPAVNITETKQAYDIFFAVPGMKKDDFRISVEGNLLTVSAEKEESKEEKEKTFTRKEYNYTSFSRSFNLPDVVNKDKIDAKYENGVLHLQLPRRAEAQQSAGRSIAVS